MISSCFAKLSNIKFHIPFPIRNHCVSRDLGNTMGNTLFLLRNHNYKETQITSFQMVSIRETNRKHIYFCSVGHLFLHLFDDGLEGEGKA